MSEYFMAVAQLHTEHGACQYCTDNTVKLNGLILVVGAFFARADTRRWSTAKTSTTRTTTTATIPATTRTTATATTRSGTMMSATTLW